VPLGTQNGDLGKTGWKTIKQMSLFHFKYLGLFSIQKKYFRERLTAKNIIIMSASISNTILSPMQNLWTSFISWFMGEALKKKKNE